MAANLAMASRNTSPVLRTAPLASVTNIPKFLNACCACSPPLAASPKFLFNLRAKLSKSSVLPPAATRLFLKLFNAPAAIPVASLTSLRSSARLIAFIPRPTNDVTAAPAMPIRPPMLPTIPDIAEVILPA